MCVGARLARRRIQFKSVENLQITLRTPWCDCISNEITRARVSVCVCSCCQETPISGQHRRLMLFNLRSSITENHVQRTQKCHATSALWTLECIGDRRTKPNSCEVSREVRINRNGCACAGQVNSTMLPSWHSMHACCCIALLVGARTRIDKGSDNACVRACSPHAL